MKFSKYNTSNRKRKKYDRTDADIMAGKMMIDDCEKGIKMPLKYYDEMSDKLCGKPSRGIYD